MSLELSAARGSQQLGQLAAVSTVGFRNRNYRVTRALIWLNAIEASVYILALANHHVTRN
eukprot:scaffold45641_cov33-Prasinocladus_malaysianus.AAC.3